MDTIKLQPLPQVVKDIATDLPEYLKDEEHLTRAAEAAIQAACEDLVTSQLDWPTFNALSKLPEDQFDFCVKFPVECGSAKVHILGIAHSSAASAAHVKKAIAEIQPTAVALESDVERTFGRTALQIPLLEMFGFDWDRLCDLAEAGGPTLAQLARVGLFESNLSPEAGQFLAMAGSFTGAPEITCIAETRKFSVPLFSVDILEKLKRAQNASLAAIPGTSRKIGDLPESVLRLVTGDQGILRAYFRTLYGASQLRETGASEILPTTLYRLCELRRRSRPCDDFLLREIHRIFRPSEFFSRIFLRDVFMAARLRALARSGGRILLVCGAAHAQGIRQLLGDAKLPDEVLTAASAAALLADGEVLQAAWRQFFGPWEPRLPRAVGGGAAAATLTVLRRVLGPRAGRWEGRGWRVENLPPQLIERESSDEAWIAAVREKYAEVWEGLLNGQIDAYPN